VRDPEMGFIRILLAYPSIPGIIVEEIPVMFYFQNKLNIFSTFSKVQQMVSSISFRWLSRSVKAFEFGLSTRL
jgi:hypothetical protein